MGTFEHTIREFWIINVLSDDQIGATAWSEAKVNDEKDGGGR